MQRLIKSRLFLFTLLLVSSGYDANARTRARSFLNREIGAMLSGKKSSVLDSSLDFYPKIYVTKGYRIKKIVENKKITTAYVQFDTIEKITQDPLQQATTKTGPKRIKSPRKIHVEFILVKSGKSWATKYPIKTRFLKPNRLQGFVFQ